MCLLSLKIKVHRLYLLRKIPTMTNDPFRHIETANFYLNWRISKRQQAKTKEERKFWDAAINETKKRIEFLEKSEAEFWEEIKKDSDERYKLFINSSNTPIT